MAQLVALYKTPADKQAFDAYYTSTHIPLAKTLPGLTRYDISTGPVGGGTDYYLVALLAFDSAEAIGAALESPEGKATAADLANFAQAGVELLIFDTKQV